MRRNGKRQLSLVDSRNQEIDWSHLLFAEVAHASTVMFGKMSAFLLSAWWTARAKPSANQCLPVLLGWLRIPAKEPSPVPRSHLRTCTTTRNGIPARMATARLNSSTPKPGHYELVIHEDGFSDYKVSSLQLDARQNLRLDAALKLATSAQIASAAP